MEAPTIKLGPIMKSRGKCFIYIYQHFAGQQQSLLKRMLSTDSQGLKSQVGPIIIYIIILVKIEAKLDINMKIESINP